MTTADRTIHAIDSVLDAHTTAYHPGQLCPEDQHGQCAARPRPVPSPEDRMRDARTDHTFATYLDRTERSQLDARAACAEQERDEARDDLQIERTKTEMLTANMDRYRQERDEALDARHVLRQQLHTARAELGAAQELLAVVDDLAEQLDRARARYATRPSEQPPGLGSAPPRAQEQPEREEIRWAYRWIGPDGQVYDEMDASDNAMETAEQRAHRIAAKRLTGTVRGEVVRYRVLTMPAEVVATYPAEDRP